ncbi:hypothetical protein AVEN_57181-1 [Araneus ventricosus]|uniref:Uncharacterized protein n=1 Tax=Araneus ventricosus TaxID=182803 RepID=A0A4Y2K562_ARAVE|nr:hypothetical protein AVEN_57181-1 [Araneus ventricosus]
MGLFLESIPYRAYLLSDLRTSPPFKRSQPPHTVLLRCLVNFLDSPARYKRVNVNTPSAVIFVPVCSGAMRLTCGVTNIVVNIFNAQLVTKPPKGQTG